MPKNKQNMKDLFCSRARSAKSLERMRHIEVVQLRKGQLLFVRVNAGRDGTKRVFEMDLDDVGYMKTMLRSTLCRFYDLTLYRHPKMRETQE